MPDLCHQVIVVPKEIRDEKNWKEQGVITLAKSHSGTNSRNLVRMMMRKRAS